MKLVWLCVGLVIAATALVCGVSMTRVSTIPQKTMTRQTIEIVLLCKTPKVQTGRDIVLWLAIRNRGQKPVLIDGRMMWPGNEFLWVKLPGSASESGAETVRPSITLPNKADLVSIQPDCFYGVEMVIGPHSDAPLVGVLKKLRRGRYTFRAIYYNPTVAKLGVEGFELSSNKVNVVVE